LLQKTFCTDFLTKTMKKNEGEVPQYFVENSHPGIVSKETFDLVQSEIRRRRESEQCGCGSSLFSGRVFCGECGAAFGSKIWQSNSKYRRTVWQCNTKYERGKRGGSRCTAPHVSEEALQTAFVAAFNQLLGGKEQYIAAFEEILPAIAGTAELDKEAAALTEEQDVVAELVRKCVEDNAHAAQDQDEYQAKYEGLTARYEAAQNRLKTIAAEKQDRSARHERIRRFLDTLRQADGLLEAFDETLWRSTVEKVTVHTGTEMTFTFRDGGEVRVNI
jgi:hypothetical protein